MTSTEHCALALDPSSTESILPASFLQSSNIRQKALALLGDRLIDLKLYEQLMNEPDYDEGLMTQTRSMVAANSNLAMYGERHMITSYISETDYKGLSEHEQATMVEAYVGALYVQCNHRITDELSDALNAMVLELRQNVFVGTHSQPSGPLQLPKRAKTVLIEMLQREGVNVLHPFFTFESLGATAKNQPPFVATFSPHESVDLSGTCLANIGTIVSDELNTKKSAENDCATKVSARIYPTHLYKAICPI